MSLFFAALVFLPSHKADLGPLYSEKRCGGWLILEFLFDSNVYLMVFGNQQSDPLIREQLGLPTHHTATSEDFSFPSQWI